jgi:hypothetical protein
MPTNPGHGSWQLYSKTSIFLGLRVLNFGLVPNPEPVNAYKTEYRISLKVKSDG